MSDNSSKYAGEEATIIFQTGSKVVESSEDPPMDEWSSLDIGIEAENPKRLLYEQGLYHPGSGEICANYIAMSASSILRHPYYNYPAIPDPGIKDALLKPEGPVIYPDDGQDHYLALCKEANLCPVRLFHRGLLNSAVDLKYYGVDPRGVRAMAVAMKYNKSVKTLDFTDNFLTVDAAYHLGDMLRCNNALEELNLSGCRIGPDGLNALLTNMISNRTVEVLNVKGNELGDTGMEYLAKAVVNGLGVKRIDLRLNNISGKALAQLSEAFETHNKFTHWNLSWNNLYLPGTAVFIKNLTESTKKLESMDLSWNSLSGGRMTPAIQQLLQTKSLQYLDLSNNKLEGEVIVTIASNLKKAVGLRTLDLSNNPMTPNDALVILKKAKMKSCRLTHLFMENVVIDSACFKLLKSIKASKAKFVITVGHLIGDFSSMGPDFRDVIFNRISYICESSKAKPDFAMFMLQYHKDKKPQRFMLGKDMIDELKENKINVDVDLLQGMAEAFPGPKVKEGRTMDLDMVVEYIKRLWPEKQLPPTPPPEPEAPLDPPTPAKKKKKK